MKGMDGKKENSRGKLSMGKRMRRGMAASALGVMMLTCLCPPAWGTSSIWAPRQTTEVVSFNMAAPYAANSAIHTGEAVLYHAAMPNGRCVAVNAGHGTRGGSDYQTLSHPDGTPKVTGGTNAEGQVYSTSISYGTTMLNGTSEAQVNLSQARILRDILLGKGYDVLMLRDGEDVQLDNVARTVLANQWADVHISLHIDSTDYDKGFFYIGVPQIASYLAMEPVSSHYQEHEALGSSILEEVKNAGFAVFGEGKMDLELTQTSYSTIPSVDLELGDTATLISSDFQTRMGNAIALGLDTYFTLYQR